ncbi:glycoside hydrolase family 28 protein [Didymella exigua CBS 183.55]|uniref:Glycoside hydrolase family 28 protein n=1 Tax=Didymella exigua CBS 183.55 TaxID=1150837 RepID=A0A6A5RHK0_9PLEO|nr:glycoside hydrolase family 28 protein [Didymella exigua CBS 183.55]KAF1925936.1 glycoside hydrolase family 28 protein [Didymella exigua CBS 183.55]
METGTAGTSGSPAANTDGADTFFSSNLLFKNWTVYNGDDSFSAKANSTNITLLNSRFYHGLGIAIGSIGQHNDQFETVENIRAEDIYFEDTLHAFYWKNQTVNARGGLFTISQCTRFSGAPRVGNCTNSNFQIRDVDIRCLRGTTNGRRVLSLQCSAVSPCTDIALSDVNVRYAGNSTVVPNYLCGNVVGNKGWDCTGPVCVGGSATGGC